MYMKKYFIYSAALLALVSSCQSDDFLGNNGGNVQTSGNETAINFAGETGKITRAAKKEGAEAAGLLDNNFVVVGFKNSEPDTKTLVFDHYNVNYGDKTAGSTASNTKGWEYVGQDYKIKGLNDKLGSTKTQTIKYWDNSCPSYDFLAFSLGKGYKATTEATATYATPTAVNSQTLTSAAYTLKGDANTLGECYISDIKTVEKDNQTTLKGYSNKAVEMSFRHATSKVRIALFENVPGYVINDVKFHDAAYTAGSTYTGGDNTGKLFGTFNNNGTLTIYFPIIGIANKENKDYNKAHINFSADTEEANGTVSSKTFGNVNYGNEDENAIAKGDQYLSQSAANPSYCGTKSDKYYITVLPAENESKAATIRIDYTLTATDGSGEKINVKNATATIPAAYTAWKHGYAYTYIFKISPNTNGTTGTPGSDSEGLTAISFDAVVLDDIETGKQETITNTTECSITTYGFKDNQVTTNNEEYPANADIYATAYIPKHNCSVEGEKDQGEFRAPNNLYTVTIEDGAVQEINESSVLNAIKSETKDANSDVWIVTDKNGKKLTVTKVTTGTEVKKVPTVDGSELTINALKWTGEAGKIYFVEYSTDCKKKAYKIVKVAAAK